MLRCVLSRSKSADALVQLQSALGYAKCQGHSRSTEAVLERGSLASLTSEQVTMKLDTITLSRLQFALIGCHIIWPTYLIGIASFITLLNILWLRTGKLVYQQLMRFWIHLFALGFVMGVVTGVVLSYEIGANWSNFSRITGNVVGPLFMYEALPPFSSRAPSSGSYFWRETRWAFSAFIRQRHGNTRHYAERFLGIGGQ